MRNASSVVLRTLCLSALCLASGGCATALGSHFGEVRSDRPVITTSLGTGQSGIGAFAGNRTPAPVPSDIPIPPEANPRVQFEVPSLGSAGTNALYGTANGISVLLNCVPDLSGKSPAGCAGQANDNFRRVVPRPVMDKGPVILR